MRDPLVRLRFVCHLVYRKGPKNCEGVITRCTPGYEAWKDRTLAMQAKTDREMLSSGVADMEQQTDGIGLTK